MKTCALCPNKIPVKYRLCGTCYKQFKEYINEPWFKEMVYSQQRQDFIDRQECNNFSINTPSTATNAIAFKKNVGRPPTPRTLVNEILLLYDTSIENEEAGLGKRLSLRKLQRAVNNKVKYLTIRRILKMYRKKEYNENTN